MNGVFLLLYTVAVGCNTVVGLDFIVVGISAAPWFPFSALPFVVWHVECYTATDASPYRISSIKRDNSWARISGVDNAWWAPSNRKKPHKRLSAEHVPFLLLLLSVTVCFDAATQHKLRIHFRRIEIDFHSMFDSMPVPGQSVTLKTLSYPEIWLPFPICLLLSHRYPASRSGNHFMVPSNHHDEPRVLLLQNPQSRRTAMETERNFPSFIQSTISFAWASLSRQLDVDIKACGCG